MFRKSMAFLCLFLFMLSSRMAYGQVQGNFPPSNERDATSNPLWITATVGSGQVRFASLGIVQRMRLEVFNQVGDRVYDSDFRDGSLLDWKLEGQEGQYLPDGLYVCTVTAEDFLGQASRRRGIVWLKNGKGAIEALPRSGVEAAAPPEAQDSVTLLLPAVALPITLLAHDGMEGRLTSGKGGLSFRLGDFFSGKDVEHMRLTADGKLGIGVEEPAAKLDVAGFIRTSEGIIFPDGTIQRSAAGVGSVSATRAGNSRDQTGGSNSVGSVARGSQSGSLANKGGIALTKSGPPGPIFATFGTPGSIGKFINSTDLGDSAMTESGANVGIGTKSPGGKLTIAANTDNLAFANAAGTGKWTQYLSGNDLRFYDATSPAGDRVTFQSGGNLGIGTANPIGKLTIAANTDNLAFANAAGTGKWTQYLSGNDLRFYGAAAPAGDRVTFQSDGNVGIGTTSPTSKLTVAGNVNVTGTGNGIIFPDGSLLSSNSAARIRAITYLAGCDTCSVLGDTDDQKTIFVNLIGSMTINSVTCFSDAGSPTVNVQRDDGSAADILSSSLTCSTAGATSTSIAPGEGTLSLNDQMHFVLASAGGVAKRVTVIVKATVN